MNRQALSEAFLRLSKIMDELREGCPWDRKQTLQSLRPLTLEEVYELVDAILEEDFDMIKEELGDVMLHLLFYSKIASEQNHFTMVDVLNGISEKLIKRHPHIYGNVSVKNEEDVKRNWENIKLTEGKKSVMAGVPKSLPSVVKATRIQEKARQVGFEWKNTGDVFLKLEEEMQELKAAVESGNIREMEDELGDVFFSLVNYARFLQIDAESALERTNKKFLHRFKRMEEMAGENGKNLSDLTLEQMDEMWNIIKSQRKEH